MKKVLLFFIMWLSVLNSFSQVEMTYCPQKDATSRVDVISKRDAKTNHARSVKLPLFEIEQMIKKDKEMEGEDMPYRFGKSFDVNYTLENGEWGETEGGRIWSMTFESENAFSLNFIFSDFYLPEGASLYISNKDEDFLYGPVTPNAIYNKKHFMTDIIPGSKATIYLFEPSEQEEQSTLVIKRIVHGYRDFGAYSLDSSYGMSYPCNVDISEHPEYEKESNGIGLVLLNNGDTFCSGSLLITTDYSFKPYFLTAFHCINRDNDLSLSALEIANAETWMFKFFYKSQNYTGNPQTTGISFNGAYFKAALYKTDFALMEIAHNLLSVQNLTWLGWDRGETYPSSGAGIHHPGGDVMKISIEDDPFTVYDRYPTGNNDYWYVNFDEGIIQPGSSGSPIFDHNKRVVGQLWGGPVLIDSCERTVAYYGRISRSWNYPNTSSSEKLCCWLDSIGTNQTIINSVQLSSLEISGPDEPCGIPQYSISNLPNGLNVLWSTSPLIPNLIFTLPLQDNICMIANNGTQPFSTNLTATITNPNGLIVKTMSKYIKNTFDVLFSQEGNIYGNIVYQDIDECTINSSGQVIVNPTCLITLQSPYFANMNITHTGATLSYWNKTGNIVQLKFPYSSSYQTATITGTDGCKAMKLYVQARPEATIPIMTLNATPTSDGFEFVLSFVGNEVDRTQTDIWDNESFVWDINIYNAVSGLKVYTRRIEGLRAIVNTTGWRSGTYIVKTVINGQEVNCKIIVK